MGIDALRCALGPTICEEIAPEDLVEVCTEYFEYMCASVISSGGTVTQVTFYQKSGEGYVPSVARTPPPSPLAGEKGDPTHRASDPGNFVFAPRLVTWICI